MRLPLTALLPLSAVLLASCGGTPSPVAATVFPATPAAQPTRTLAAQATPPLRLPPAGKLAWDWQIGAATEAKVALPAGVSLLDLDGFETSAAKVAGLKAQGVYAVCYLNVGSYESYRPDAAQYPDFLKIQTDPNWPDESFVDIRDVFREGSVLAGILDRRLALCADKGFDAVEPDNLQNDQNVTSGVITRQDQLDFNGWLADRAHAHGLAILQKNGPDSILQADRQGRLMVDLFDGVLNESCQRYKECGPLAEYVRRGKLALNVEYRQADLNCAAMNSLGVNSIFKDLYLVGKLQKAYKRVSCTG